MYKWFTTEKIDCCENCPMCDDFNWCKSLHKPIKDLNCKLKECNVICIDDNDCLVHIDLAKESK